MSALSLVLKRDRVVIGTVSAVIAAVAWGYLIYEARRMNARGVCECLAMKMGGPDPTDWRPMSLLPLFLMWAGMMVAMMLPSATPMIVTFAAVSRNRRRQERPYVPVAVFVLGYLTIWCGFSVLAAIVQWLLHRKALLSPAMSSSSALFAGGLILFAGLFQLTPLKQSCLRQCRSPLQFIMTRWREGFGGAFIMGLEHGAFCTGCCWALMALLFVTGVMNIFWVAILTLAVAVEKLLPRQRWVSLTSALLLVAWGTWVLTHHSLG
jgi:predicted metal-binding membrane protein